MLKRMIIIENNEQIQCDTLEDVVRTLIDENYYNMTKEEKTKKMKTKALANCITNRRKIIQNVEKNEFQNLDEVFIIKDEITYILSLLMINKILLLERKDSNVFSSKIDKEKIKENYLIINTFAKELLKNYIINNITEN